MKQYLSKNAPSTKESVDKLISVECFTFKHLNTQ